MKIAIVHDWLATYTGAERVLEQMLHCFPKADVFAVVDFLTSEEKKDHFQNKTIQTTFIQKLPGSRKHFRAYLSLMPLAIEQLDLSNYDIIISNCHAVAKGLISSPYQLHISYTNALMRYIWDLQKLYLSEANLSKGLKGWLARYLLHKMRIWDTQAANRVDQFVANSVSTAQRIMKLYRRTSSVIYPPVDTDRFVLNEKKDDFYLTVSRLVPYKRVDVLVQTFTQLKDKKLYIIGMGPELEKLKRLAAPNIQFLGQQSSSVVSEYIQRAKAFVFASEEVFGIAPVEAQACGTPVIAYGRGGSLETIKGSNQPNPTGLFFAEQTSESLISAIQKFETLLFKPTDCRNNALRFSIKNFKDQFQRFVEKSWQDHQINLHNQGILL